ncbi:hypothetical protein NC652_027384 [Populus alba x Populus x berolinensis]|nr:hypothetical protein NC652_027384 [Populus alba x Populus x berolinensis]
MYHPREALKCIQIGLLCVQEDAADRPSMLAVLFMLSNETEIPSPKQSAFLFRKSYKFPDIALDVEDGQCSVNEHAGQQVELSRVVPCHLLLPQILYEVVWRRNSYSRTAQHENNS